MERIEKLTALVAEVAAAAPKPAPRPVPGPAPTPAPEPTPAPRTSVTRQFVVTVADGSATDRSHISFDHLEHRS